MTPISALFTLPSAFAASSAWSSVVTTTALSQTASATVTLSALNVSSASQNFTGTLTTTVNATNGTGAAWSQTITATRGGGGAAPTPTVTTQTSPLATIDTTNTNFQPATTLAHSSEHCVYTVTVGTGGAVGTATYSVTLSGSGCTDGTMQSAVITAATNNAVGNSGLKINFPAGTYVAADSWKVVLDEIDYSQITVTPATPTATSGSLTGVTAGSSGAFSGASLTSSARTIMSATVGNGMGAHSCSTSISIPTINGVVATYKWTTTITAA